MLLSYECLGGLRLHFEAAIREHKRAADGYYYLSLHAPEIAARALPGQFLHIRCVDSLDPLLRRPFSFCRIDRSAGTIAVLYEVRGKGTALLTERVPGQRLDILGPLGNGYDLDCVESDTKTVLVGGGIGGAPMVALAERLMARGVRSVTVLLGAPHADKLVPEEFFSLPGTTLMTATEDGSSGYHGFVTELLPSQICGTDKVMVFACGPPAMLKVVGEYSIRQSIPCQLSLDAVMACGVGACQGCACRVEREDMHFYARACTEGPIFDAREVIWE